MPMKDETEGMELVPDETLGKFYSATDLKRLADEGAKRANASSKEYFVSTEWLMLPNDRTEFVVKCKRVNIFAELLIKVKVRYAEGGGIATRSLSVYGTDSRDEELQPLQLKTDGNPTVFIDERKLSEPELIDELVRPVLEAT